MPHTMIQAVAAAELAIAKMAFAAIFQRETFEDPRVTELRASVTYDDAGLTVVEFGSFDQAGQHIAGYGVS